jgi:hypothetical protein
VLEPARNLSAQGPSTSSPARPHSFQASAPLGEFPTPPSGATFSLAPPSVLFSPNRPPFPASAGSSSPHPPGPGLCPSVQSVGSCFSQTIRPEAVGRAPQLSGQEEEAEVSSGCKPVETAEIKGDRKLREPPLAQTLSPRALISLSPPAPNLVQTLGH